MESACSSLEALGYPRAQVLKALEIAEGNIDTAVELLSCGGLNDLEPRQCKLVVLVRSDLQMTVGKIASQVAHAALGAANTADSGIRSDWDEGGEAIIVLSVSSYEEMAQLESSARSVHLNTYIVRDAGRTQVDPGSATVCGIGPDEVSKIDQITRHLRLL